MSLPRKIFYNTLAQSAGKLGAAAIGVITVSLLYRHLHDSGFGEYATVVAYLGFFAMLADLGLYLIVTREISREGTDRPKIISNALGLRLAAALALLIFGALFSLVLPYSPVVRAGMVVGMGALLFVSLNQVLVGVFQKHLIQHLLVVTETAGRFLNLVLVYLFLRQDLPLPFLLLALLFGNALTFAGTVWVARRYEPFGITFDLSEWKKLLGASWPLIFAIVLNLVYFRTDTVILSLFHPAATIGVYSFPYKNLEGLLAFPAMFVGLIMPLLSKTAGDDWPKFKIYLQSAFDALVVMAAPVVLAVWFFAKSILDFLSRGQTAPDSPGLLQILIVAVAVIFLGTLFSYAVVAVNKQKAMIRGYLLAASVALIIYFGFIPSHSYWAAAWGTVVSELIVLVYAYILVQRASGQNISWQIFWRLLPAALLMAGFYYLANLYWLLEIFLGLGVYILGLLIFRAVPSKFLKELFFLER